MKARSVSLPNPPVSSPRYWVEKLPDPLGDSTFKLPVLSSAEIFGAVSQENQLASIGLILGFSWAHRDFELEAPVPGVASDMTALLAYGTAVLDELQDYLTIADLIAVANRIGEKFKAAIPSPVKIQEKKDHFLATQDSKSA